LAWHGVPVVASTDRGSTFVECDNPTSLTQNPFVASYAASGLAALLAAWRADGSGLP
jgi:hypothetical protein